MSLVQTEGYSATVDIRLEVNGMNYKVAQVGVNELVLVGTCRIPEPVDGRLLVDIDGEKSDHNLFFYEGIDTANPIVRFF